MEGNAVNASTILSWIFEKKNIVNIEMNNNNRIEIEICKNVFSRPPSGFNPIAFWSNLHFLRTIILSLCDSI